MEALSLMKLWLTNANGNKPRREIITSDSTALGDPQLDDLHQEDDSFFDLEISDFSLRKNKTHEEKKEEKQTTTFPVVSKSKVLPQSPTTPLKSGQKFGAFSFKTTEKKKENNDRSLNARFRFEDETTSFYNDSVSSVSSTSSKRFFDLIKPLYIKTTKKQSVNSASPSPASSPAAGEKQRINIRSVKRQLGKSRSASAAVGAMSPAKRLDESLQVQQDEIRSAILHCKKSFHGSRESSMLSRSTSESSSQEKLSTSSSEDSYLFSRVVASNSMSEKSIDSLTSGKEQVEKISY